MISNSLNQQKWREVVTKEINDRFHTLLSSTTILCGQLKVGTRLPMPAVDGEKTVSINNTRMSVLEGAIIT